MPEKKSSPEETIINKPLAFKIPEPNDVVKAKTEDFLKIVRNKIENFKNLSNKYKTLHLFVKFFTVVIAGIAIPGIIFILNDERAEYYKIAVGIASLLVAVFAGLDGIFHFRNQWRTYEALKDYLASQMHKFIFKGGSFIDLNEEQRLSKFVDLVEDVEYYSRQDILDILSKVDKPASADSAKVIAQPQVNIGDNNASSE